MSDELTKTPAPKEPYKPVPPSTFKRQEYEEFLVWFAMPSPERRKLGAKMDLVLDTQTQWGEFYNVSDSAISRWKRRADFRPRVDALRREWGYGRTSDVIAAIFKSAIKGNPQSQKIWMQYFTDFTERKEEVNRAVVEIGVNDIRFLIEALPEPLKSEHYANLQKLLDDAAAVADSGRPQDGVWEARPADEVPGEADHAPQDVPVAEANLLAAGDP